MKVGMIMNSTEFCIKLNKLFSKRQALSALDIMEIKKDLKSLNLPTAAESPVWVPGVVYVKQAACAVDTVEIRRQPDGI